MKVSIDLDLTPEEARRLLGLPDIQPMQERLMAQMEKQMMQNMSYLDPETMMKVLVPAGAQGLEKFQEMLWGMARSAMNEGGTRRRWSTGGTSSTGGNGGSGSAESDETPTKDDGSS